MQVAFFDLKRQYQQYKDRALTTLEEIFDSQGFTLGPHVEQLERRYQRFPGLNLTREVLESQSSRIDKVSQQPGPLLEAQACGCKVIAANKSAIPEVAGENAVLVEPTVEGTNRSVEYGHPEWYTD